MYILPDGILFTVLLFHTFVKIDALNIGEGF
jgi:hypothetical protein